MNKTIVITGISTGIGAGLAEHFLKTGYHVVGTVRKESDADYLKSHERFSYVVMDVTDRSATSKLVETTMRSLGNEPLYALINNAGIAIAAPMECLPDEEFEKVIDVNVLAVRRITNALLPMMAEGSRIVNISSVSGLFSSPFTGAYCISKHALESMTDVYRRELQPFGIKVSAIEPGPIKTPIWSKSKGTLDRFFGTRYGAMLKNADKIIENAERSGLSVEEVRKSVQEALESEDPATRYLIHPKKFLFKVVSKWLPDKWADSLVAKTMKGGKKHRAV